MELGDIVRKLRKEKNITQEELGKILGVEKTTISMYETNRSRPDDYIKSAMADYFGVTVDYLLGRSNNRQLTKKDEIDIQHNLEEMKEKLEDGVLRMSLDGEYVDDEIKQFILNNMEDTLTLAKIKAKEKYTPKKYKK